MKVNGVVASVTERAGSSSMMALSTLVIGTSARPTAKASSLMLLAKCTTASGLLAKLMGTESSVTRAELYTRGIGLLTNSTALGMKCGPMVAVMKAITCRA